MQQTAPDDYIARKMIRAVDIVKMGLLSGLAGQFRDLSFIGNASQIYEWTPCQMVDLDCFLFSEEIDYDLGLWLFNLRNRLKIQLENQDIDFEIKIIEGPYKPAIDRISRPIITAHLGVFTETTYQMSPSLKRWAWRKYSCEIEKGKLNRLAPPRPTLDEFIYSPKGLKYRLEAIRAGKVQMTEWDLPSLNPKTFFLNDKSISFQECCFAYASNCARNHIRSLGLNEADTLGNEDFFPWYVKNIFPCDSLIHIFKMKLQARNQGFSNTTESVKILTIDFLERLASFLGMQP